jgi:hypothetical protein
VSYRSFPLLLFELFISAHALIFSQVKFFMFFFYSILIIEDNLPAVANDENLRLHAGPALY